MTDPNNPILLEGRGENVEGGDGQHGEERNNPPPPQLNPPSVLSGSGPSGKGDRAGPLLTRPLQPVPYIVGVGRNGTPGADTSNGNVYYRNPLNIPASNPVGSVSQNSTEAFMQLTFPVQKVEVVTADNFKVWRVKMRMAATNMRCAKAFESSMPNTAEDNAAMFLLSNAVPVEWQGRVLDMGSAYEGVCWVCEQFCGGSNTYLVDELERKFAALKFSPKESYDQYVNRANNLASNLTSNGRAVSKTSLVTKIVAGLPDLFNNSKASLRLTGKGWSLDELCAEIKAEAFRLGCTESSVPAAKALIAEGERARFGTSSNQGSNGGNGNQYRKFNGTCWHCGVKGHVARDCNGPNKEFAFRPQTEKETEGSNEAEES